MKKVLLVVTIAALAATSGQAQTLKSRKPNFGFKTGVNASNIIVDGADSYDLKGGLVAGLFFTIKAGSKFSIQPEFLYSSMGGKTTTGFTDGSLRLNYFSIPVLAKFGLKKKVYLVAGPQLDILIAAKSRTSAGESSLFTDATNNYKENSYNGTAGFEFWPSSCLNFTARYIRGFNSINRFGTSDFKNQGVQFSLGVKL